MDKNLKLRELKLARRVAEGEKSLSRQRKVVAELESNGQDATVARQLLETFDRTQAIDVREVVREWMDLLPLARERAQLCAERARLTLDPMMQARWRAQANAWAIVADHLEATQRMIAGGNNDLAVTMVAKRIVELAKCGERNPRRLRDHVLTSFRHGFDGKV
jgi:hypothetical protein